MPTNQTTIDQVAALRGIATDAGQVWSRLRHDGRDVVMDALSSVVAVRHADDLLPEVRRQAEECRAELGRLTPGMPELVAARDAAQQVYDHLVRRRQNVQFDDAREELLNREVDVAYRDFDAKQTTWRLQDNDLRRASAKLAALRRLEEVLTNPPARDQDTLGLIRAELQPGRRK